MQSSNAERWRASTQEEINSLDEQDVDSSRLTQRTKIIKCKWVYKIKHEANSTIRFKKSRLTAKRFTQTLGIDTASMRLVEALLRDWWIDQLDVVCAMESLMRKSTWSNLKAS